MAANKRHDSWTEERFEKFRPKKKDKRDKRDKRWERNSSKRDFLKEEKRIKS